MFAAAVLLSVIGLLLGPVLVSWMRGTRTAFAALDGATLGIIVALVLLRLLPHLVEEAGAIEAIVPGQGLDLGFVAWPLVVLLAVVLRIGAAGVTVVAALLVHKGLSLPSALVFIGLAAHLSSSKRAGLPPPVTVRALAALGSALIVMHLWGPRETPPLHALAAHPHPLIEWLAAAVITTWALFQLVTSGPRIWFQGTRPPSSNRPADGPSPMQHRTP